MFGGSKKYIGLVMDRYAAGMTGLSVVVGRLVGAVGDGSEGWVARGLFL